MDAAVEYRNFVYDFKNVYEIHREAVKNLGFFEGQRLNQLNCTNVKVLFGNTDGF